MERIFRGPQVLTLEELATSGQVLKSQKISSENHNEVKTVLQTIRREWGIPLAIVSDLRRALITAGAAVFKGVPQFVCHYHLAADVGKDILSKHQDALRGLFRRTKVKADLQALKRSLRQYAVCKESTSCTKAPEPLLYPGRTILTKP